MKNEGFVFQVLSLPQAQKKFSLPLELSLWGDFANFNQLNFDHRQIKVACLTYYQQLTAAVVFYQSQKWRLLKFASSPHSNQEVQFGHVYVQPQTSQRALEQVLDELALGMTSYCRTHHLWYFRIAFPPQYLDQRAWKKYGWQVAPHYTYQLDVGQVKKVGTRQYIGKKIRNLVKYAQQRLTIKPITAKLFYDCYSDTYQRQGKKAPHPPTFFKRLQALPNARCFGAYQGRQLAAGIIFIEVGTTAFYITSGVKDAFANANGTTLLLFSYLDSLTQQNDIQKLDLFGANSPQVAYFKAGFEPTVQVYFSATYSPIPWL